MKTSNEQSEQSSAAKAESPRATQSEVSDEKKLMADTAYRRYLRPSFTRYTHLIVATILLALFGALFEGVSVALLIPFLQSMDSGSTGMVTGVDWLDTNVLGVGLSTVGRLNRISLVIIAVSWLRFVLAYAGSLTGTYARTRIVADLRKRCIHQLQSVAVAFFSKSRAGDILNTVTGELARVGAALTVVIESIGALSLLLVYVVFMVAISWQLTAGTLVFLLLLTLALTRLVKSIRTYGYRSVDAHSEFTSTMTEYLAGVKTVVASNTQGFERRRLFERVMRIAHAVFSTVARASLVNPISSAAVTTAIVLIVLVAVRLFVLPGTLDIALLLAFMFALLRMVPKVHTINAQRGQWAQVTGAMAKVGNLLREDDKPYLKDGSREVGPLKTGLRVEAVNFHYAEGEPVLFDVSIDIPRGKTTALVGASGAGKTTLVDLLPRFYDPTDGRITWDGVDLRDYMQTSLRSRIAVVSQDTFVFNDTIAANIAYGSKDVTEAQIREVARQAEALEFIEEMPDGLDTVLGDRGVRLSGGQRQRIAIARALLRDPDLLILDEATSALDSISEKAVQSSLEQLMKGRTVVAIAHRLSTIENADNIVVLEKGRVVEQGTFAELTSRQGQFWEYYSIQFQSAESS